jgi:hypothetical protein
MPQSADALSEGAQPLDVAGYPVVLVVASDDLPEPCTDVAWAVMQAAAQLSSDSLELRHHPLFRREPPDGEGVRFAASPTAVGKALDVERLWFSLPLPRSVSGCEAPELDQPRLLRGICLVLSGGFGGRLYLTER